MPVKTLRILPIAAGIWFGCCPAWADDKPAVAISQDASDYPASANGQSGAVVVSFTIDPSGHVTEEKIESSTPPGVFDQAALATVAGWSYQPRELDGKPAAQAGNEVRLRFVPPPPTATLPVPIVPVTPGYTIAAYRAKQEGDVTVGFDVDALGRPMNVRVINSTNPGWFDTEAVNLIEHMAFSPAALNGVPQEADGLSTTLQFRLATAKIQPVASVPIKPIFPPEMASQGIEGTAFVEATEDADGNVSSPRVLFSTPSPLFGEAVVAAIPRMKYLPDEPDISAQMNRTVRLYVNFRFQGGPIGLYALKPHQWVKLSYTLTASGRARDIKVLATSDPGIKTIAAVDQLRQTNFAPIQVNGVPADVPNQVIFINGPSEADYAQQKQ